MSNIINKIKNLYAREYNIGFIESSLEKFWNEDFNPLQVRWMDYNGHKGSWFADPFILNVQNEYIEIIAEEMVEGLRGRISVITVDKVHYKLIKIRPILELDTHLSFPNYIKIGEDLYIFPENNESGSLNLYKFNITTYQLDKIKELVHGPILDAQILFKDGYCYLFGIKEEKTISGDYYKLYIYRANSIFDSFTLFQTIENQKNLERGAGAIFFIDDKIIRPAQNCEGDYGKEVILYELVFTGNKFSEHEIRRLSPVKNKRWGKVLHTFNHKDGLIVIDGYDFKRPYIGPILRPIATCIFNLFH